MSASHSVNQQQSSVAAPSGDNLPPSYSSLFPEYPQAEQSVGGSVNSNQRVCPSYHLSYPQQQQYIFPQENTPLVAPKPVLVYTTQPSVTTTTVVYVGTCPLCRVGILEDDYPCAALCCAILFFPIGLLCCLALRQKRCNNCGYVID